MCLVEDKGKISVCVMTEQVRKTKEKTKKNRKSAHIQDRKT